MMPRTIRGVLIASATASAMLSVIRISAPELPMLDTLSVRSMMSMGLPACLGSLRLPIARA